MSASWELAVENCGEFWLSPSEVISEGLGVVGELDGVATSAVRPGVVEVDTGGAGDAGDAGEAGDSVDSVDSGDSGDVGDAGVG